MKSSIAYFASRDYEQEAREYIACSLAKSGLENKADDLLGYGTETN